MGKQKKLVLFDHVLFTLQQFGGVSRYFAEIMKRIDPELWDVSVINLNNEYLKEIGENMRRPNFFEKMNYFRGKGRLMRLYSLYKIAKNDYGVLHLTHYDGYANRAAKRPVVITYHDKIFSTYSYDERVVREQKKCFARADKIITVSDHTKNDLLSLFDVDEKKIVTIHHGASENTYPQKERIIKERYILYVGWRSVYKNFPRFLNAYAQITEKEMPELKLVCTGLPFNDEELTMNKSLGIPDGLIVNPRYYSTEDLHNLYQNAELFVFPSENEGFGLPLLEAMQNDCPVACSNTTCFPEIAGDAAEYFDPLDVDDIYAAMRKVLFSADVRKKLVESGRTRCKQFTWEESARKHVEVYKSLI